MANNPVRFLMLGGFLGAGKTTTIARLARSYMEQGLRVGIVTNDQDFNLVDTMALKAQGFDVGEVPGACFCCKFDDLVRAVEDLREGAAPDVVITEPVGSCTDLVATVIEPLRHLHQGDYCVAPLAVLLKPEHGQRILRQERGMGFSPKAAYIFLKQLEEADIIVINKIDKLTKPDQDELVELIEDRFPGRTIVLYSARSGKGHVELLEELSRERPSNRATMEVDYDVYAEGEAELGWLNATHRLTLGECHSLDQIVLDYVGLVRDQLQHAAAEPAHLKILGQSADRATALANLVGSDVDVELSISTTQRTERVELTVNARVAAAPEVLSECVRQALNELAEKYGGIAESLREQSFRPGRPTPTHRMGASG